MATIVDNASDVRDGRWARIPKQLCLITLWLSLLGMGVTIFSFAFPHIPVAVLCFYFGLLWFLWIACAILRVEPPGWRLFLTWLSIDISILLMFLSAMVSLGDVRHSQGTDVVWGIAYFPFVLAFAPLARLLPHDLLQRYSTAFDFLSERFPNGIGGTLADWISFSLLAAGVSLLVLVVAWGGRKVRVP